MDSFADYGIDVSNLAGPEVQTTCPQCSSQRKKKNAKCLSVNVEKKTWICHHCGFVGGIGVKSQSYQKSWKPPPRRPDPRPHIALPQNALDWFHARAITDMVLLRNRIDYGRVYMPQTEDSDEAIIFPYFRDGELVNRKYRTLQEKHFRLDTGCELVLYGLDDIDAEKPLVWVEGEMDKLSVEVAGFKSVVSVPNGAPPPNAKNYDSKFEFIEADWQKLEKVKTHVLALDSDAPGLRLEAELSRRLGTDKCSRVRWPEGVKDANEMLMKHGADELMWYIENPELFPIEGVVMAKERREEIFDLYSNGYERGSSTGWAVLDNFYTVRPGEFTAVTGIPSSGKSNWIDCMLVNLASLNGWRFGLFSPENLPVEQHIAAIAEKYRKQPFYDGPTVRMSKESLDKAVAWIDEHFKWILPSSEDDWTVDKILAAASSLCLRHGIRGLVIDPWNELEPMRPKALSETEYISQCLKRVRAFARQRRIHVWIVVHPAKLYRKDDGNYPVPTLYDASGSAHWRNKADNGIVVWRDLSGADSAEVEIHIQKIRFRQIGKRGMVTLYYEPVCATYRDKKI